MVLAPSAVLPKNNPHAVRFKFACAIAESGADGEVLLVANDCGSFDEPNRRPEISSVLQADKSGRSAAAVNHARLDRVANLFVADLVFTLHLMIANLALVISALMGKNNCRNQHHDCQACLKIRQIIDFECRAKKAPN